MSSPLEKALAPLLAAHRDWTRANCLTRCAANTAYAEKCEARALDLENAYRTMLAVAASVDSPMNCTDCRDAAEFGSLCGLHTSCSGPAEKLVLAKGAEAGRRAVLVEVARVLACPIDDVLPTLELVAGHREVSNG